MPIRPVPEGSPEQISAAAAPVEEPAKTETDPFEEIDFGSFFDDYLDPGFKSPASESVEKPSFETFLSYPVRLSDHCNRNSVWKCCPSECAKPPMALSAIWKRRVIWKRRWKKLPPPKASRWPIVQAGLKAVQSLEPTGVGAQNLRECLLLQLEARDAKDSVAWKIVHDHLRLETPRQFSHLAKALGPPAGACTNCAERHPPSGSGARSALFGSAAQKVEPDVYIFKEGDEYVITLNDDEIPQLRLNADYRWMIDRGQQPDKDVRNWVKERYASALLLIKNIEQRKQTILRVCQSIVRRQGEFLESGIDALKPMMIKEVAEEIGVHPSTVSRAVANKYAHTPQGIFELRYFFSEAVQGPVGSATPLLVVKKRVKKMIVEEDASHPLTDEQITARLQAEGIQVTRRTVAKYREDMNIPSTHQRRVRPE